MSNAWTLNHVVYVVNSFELTEIFPGPGYDAHVDLVFCLPDDLFPFVWKADDEKVCEVC